MTIETIRANVHPAQLPAKILLAKMERRAKDDYQFANELAAWARGDTSTLELREIAGGSSLYYDDRSHANAVDHLDSVACASRPLRRDRLEIGRRYAREVGYNPFADSPELTVAEVSETLAEFLEECAA